jgi:hypothetical protein
MMRHLLIIFAFLSGAWLGCERSIDWELSPTESRLVVEAILTDEMGTQQIHLSQTFSDINGTPPPVTNASVTVHTQEEIIPFLPDPDLKGDFLSEIPFAVAPDAEYRLEISWDNKAYTATSQLSEVQPIPNPAFIPIANTDSMRLGDFVPIFDPIEQAYYQVDIDWAHLDTAALTQARLYFYTFSSIDMSQLLPPPREPVLFPKGSLVTITKYGLNDEFADYQRAKAIETDWAGNFFFGVSDNLPTNIQPDGLGFFSTCAIQRAFFIAE